MFYKRVAAGAASKRSARMGGEAGDVTPWPSAKAHLPLLRVKTL